MRKLTIGILAHVDAGKTTLVESILYKTGNIRKLGRVDHKDAFLDTFDLEKDRGITIFSKEAIFKTPNYEITLLDTPGHVDFSTDMERTLSVLDYAIMVISGTDGVQGHTETLWELLERYKVPTFIFINKMDMETAGSGAIMGELKKTLSDACIDFTVNKDSIEFMENIAILDEKLLDKYLKDGSVGKKDIIELINKRKVFPCYFGSALKLEGVEMLIKGIDQYTKASICPQEFGAKVYKISRDEQGNRLTHMKVTGGSLKVKMQISNSKESDNTGDINKPWEEKVDQIRLYSGEKFEVVDEVKAGSICTVVGLTKTYPGQGLGFEQDAAIPLLEPVLNYKIILPEESNVYSILSNLRMLEDEDPQLQIVWSEQLKEIHIKLMGEVQIDVIKQLIKRRFGLDVEFGTGDILYKETIEEAVVGVGHFEPLGHYSEVHLLMEPNTIGAGLEFYSKCNDDELEGSWQRLVLTHLHEKEHIGVLTGSPITDMKISLINGRAHNEHTVGGDFREATYRAVRQGLKKAKNVLLEPYYNFKLKTPLTNLGRAMTDIQRMNGKFQPPKTEGDMSTLIGYAPVAMMKDYHTKVISYTRGRGSLFCTLRGYLPCHNAEEVIETIAYDSERDNENPTGSIFCANGAGFNVKWDKVEEYMHLDSSSKIDARFETKDKFSATVNKKAKKDPIIDSWDQDKELEEIFVRTYGPISNPLSHHQNRLGREKTPSKVDEAKHKQKKYKLKKKKKEYLLVDGYNIIHAWSELKELAEESMDAARGKLIDILSNYQGYKGNVVIIVFDAYKVDGGVRNVEKHGNINVVFTKEAETADQYIEKITHEIAKDNRVTVATSDALEQIIIMGKGAYRLSAYDLMEEIKWVCNNSFHFRH